MSYFLCYYDIVENKKCHKINLPICRERVEILFFYWSDSMELLINILAYIIVSVYVLSIIVFSIVSFVLANIDRFKNEEAQDEDYY